jgi:alpha-tubulin suppressor-like RCC1 family protein
MVDAVALVAGDEHNCALRASGGIACWGDNTMLEVGAPPTTALLDVPYEIEAAPPMTVLLSAGSRHTCAGSLDGGVRCWGDNSHGELGSGAASGPVRAAAIALGFP